MAQNTAGEKRHIFDNPRNVRRVLYVLYSICAGLLLADFFIARHHDHAWEITPAFYCLYGFVACVALVLIAKELRKVLRRAEDYYDG